MGTVLPLLLALHLAATAAYTAILWLVQVVVYPQFANVPAPARADYHRDHCRRIGRVIAPVFVAEGVTAILVASMLFARQPVLQSLSVALFLLGTVLTAAVFVPLHKRLPATGFAEGDLRRLVRRNWWRTIVSSIRTAVVVAISVCWWL